jgi:hypothetical protein
MPLTAVLRTTATEQWEVFRASLVRDHMRGRALASLDGGRSKPNTARVLPLSGLVLPALGLGRSDARTMIWVDLRGQLSNRPTRANLDFAAASLSPGPGTSRSVYHAAMHESRLGRISARVDVEELVRCFADGAMIKELAAKHAISESTVKRLLRSRGTRR